MPAVARLSTADALARIRNKYARAAMGAAAPASAVAGDDGAAEDEEEGAGEDDSDGGSKAPTKRMWRSARRDAKVA